MKIVNRIVTALIAAATFPFLITQLFFRIIISIDEDSVAYSIITAFAGQDNILTGNRLGIQESLWSIYKMFADGSESSMDFDFMKLWNSLPEELDKSKIMIIASLACVALGVLIAVVIIGCAFFTRAYKTIIALGGAGFASFLSAIVLFGQAGKPLQDGSVDALRLIAQLLMGENTSGIGSIIAGFLEGTLSVDSFSLGGAVFGAMIMMIGVMVWEFAYLITLPENEKPKKKIKKAKKA